MTEALTMEIDSVDSQFMQELISNSRLSPDAKPSAFTRLLNKLLSTPDAKDLEQNLSAYVTSLIGGDSSATSDQLSIVTLRPLLDDFTAKLKSLGLSTEIQIPVVQHAIELLRARVTSFPQQDTSLKQVLADAYEADEDYTSSARILRSIDLDSAQQHITDTDKAQIWIRIARCYLEEDNPTDAATFINKVKGVKDNITDKTMRLQFHMAQARIYDSQRQFLDASAAYHTMSFEAVVDEDDRLQTLSAAIRCAVLAPAGPQRSRMLAKLYKDDRAAQVEEYSILEKIFLDRLLNPNEVAAFAAKLLPHQLAKTADGTTVLDRAVLEHNLLGVSKLYRNIGIANLGALLGVDGERAEQYAAQMIEQGRLSGHIDQIDEIIFFNGEATGERLKSDNQAGATGMTELRRWDAAVASVAEEVEKVATMIQTAFPDFYAANMVF